MPARCCRSHPNRGAATILWARYSVRWWRYSRSKQATLGVTILVLLYPHLPIARIIGTDIAHAVPLTLVAGLGHLAVGTVDLSLLASLLVGLLPGIALGSVTASRAPERALRLLLAAVLTLVGVRLADRQQRRRATPSEEASSACWIMTRSLRILRAARLRSTTPGFWTSNHPQ
jgi:hypothetical protein